MRISKKWMAIGIVIVAIAAMFYYSQGEWVDGAPEMSVTVRLTEAGTTNAMEAEVDIGEGRATQTVVPMTAVSATIFAVEPNTAYEVEFWNAYNAAPQDPAMTGVLYGDVTMMGDVEYNGITHTFTNIGQSASTMSVENQQLDYPDYTATAAFTKANNAYWDGIFTAQGGTSPLLGKYLDNSVWTCTVTTATAHAGTDAHYGQTEVTITLIVDTNGNVDISVTDVDMTASEV